MLCACIGFFGSTMPKLFSYVVDYDYGYAPCPFGGFRQVAEGQLQGRRSWFILQAPLRDEAAKLPGKGSKEGLPGMSKQVVLLRVGIDSGCGGIQGPLFDDGSFEFVCISDNHRVSAHTYGNMLGRDG